MSRRPLGTKSAIEKLEIFLAGEESILGGHPYAGDDVILNQTAEWFSGCGNEVLVVCVRNEHGLGASHLIF